MWIACEKKPLLCVLACMAAVFGVSRPEAEAADWPAYRMDNARTATTPEKLRFPMSPAWVYKPAHKPQPAWPDPFLIRGRGKNFDAAPQPVMVGETVYFGSTTDDTLWALDAATGQTKWGFTTGGPVRFAPAIADGRAYVVSDDGWAYCLDAATGKLIWKFFGGLSDRRLPGNGRMISRWPIRGGVAVKDGVVHFAAGMWSSEGVYVYALDAGTGRRVWCNDTNLDYLPMPHASTAHTGNMPQGYLALGGNRVVYNNGVGGSWEYDARTGRLTGRSGGTETLKKAKGGDYQEYEPSKFLNWSLLILDAKTGETLHHGEPEDSAEKRGLVPIHAALAGDTLIKCEGGKVVAVDKAGKGRQVWRHAVEGTASGIAVAGGRLLIGTTDGAIYCFKPGEAGTPAVVGPAAATLTPTDSHRGAAPVLAELAKRKINRGYALVLGERDAKLAEALAAQTEMQVICLLTDEAKADAERKRLLETTALYGVRITVDHWRDTTRLPFAQYLANLIVVTARPPGLPAGELARVQRPCGGILMEGDKVAVRGKLPGALDWDSEITSDQRVRGTLELLWFGEPGPTHSVKMTPSIAAGGRLFVFGPNGNVLTAVDAYNGTVLWTRKVDENAKVMVADDRCLYAGKLVLDAQTGQDAKGAAGKRPPVVKPLRSEADEEKYLNVRQHPLTDGLSSKAHDRLHGCSAWASSASMEFFRSSTIAYYDYVDDSGIRNFGGVRPGCADSLTPALGLLLYGESTGVPHGRMGSSCSCAYPFKTSLALAPAEQRRNEDWAVFQDIPWPQSGSLRHVAINCGAPGDRRDDDRKLWLAAPRPQGPSGWSFYKKVTFTLPYMPEFFGEPRHFRANSDRLAVEGTDRPWLYASGYVGIRRLTWDLDYYNRYSQCLSLPAVKAPNVDGTLGDACWTGASELLQPYTPPRHKDTLPPDYADPAEAAYARHDDENLYLAYRKRLVADRRGNVAPIKAATQGRDAPVWQDDSFELFLSDGSGDTVIHLGVAACGAVYDSLLRFAPLPEDAKAAKEALKAAPREDTSFNGDWASKVRLDKQLFAVEIAIPWKMLTDLGIRKNDLRLNLSHVRSPHARKPFTRQANEASLEFRLSDTKPAAKPYTVRLHFAEPTDGRPGQRVFDVVLGDRAVLKDFDVFAEAGGRNRALVKEIRGVPAVQHLVLEFIPRGGKTTDAGSPILCGLEIIAEQPGSPPDPVYARLVGRRGHTAFVRYSDAEKRTDNKEAGAGKAKD